MNRAEPLCVDINSENIDLLKGFIGNLGKASETFRYYNKRSADIISHHLTTLMLLSDDIPVAYGHLDPENEIIWLGICVLPDYKGMGFGNLMMEKLIGKAKEHNVDKIDLTVDKDNLHAIRLYEKFRFAKTDDYHSYFRYRLVLIPAGV